MSVTALPITSVAGTKSQEWVHVPLAEICRINAPIVDPRSVEFRDLPHVSGEDIESGTGRLLALHSAAEDGMTSGKYLFDAGVVLYSKLRPYLCKVAVADFRGLCSADMYPLVLDRSRVCLDFAKFGLLSEEFTAYAIEASARARMPKLNREQLLAYEFPLPPLEEQERIATRLTMDLVAVDKARHAAQERLAAAEALSAAYLREVFEGAEASEWEMWPIGNLVENLDGQRIPVKLADRANRKGPYPYYGASGIIDSTDQFLFDGEFLLVAEDGANLVARSTPIAFKATGRFWVNNHAHVLRPHPPLPVDYFVHALAVTDISDYVTGSAQPKLSQGKLNEIAVPVPPADQVVSIVEGLNSRLKASAVARDRVEEELALIECLPASLLRTAFGEGNGLDG